MVESRNARSMHQLPQGTLLRGRYRILQVIGQGGFGITYRGRDQVLEMDVAIKEYFPNGLVTRYSTASADAVPLDERSGERFLKGRHDFLREARILAKFSDDPNIVNVRDFFEENNTAYIVMEYLEGASLQQLLTRYGRLPFNEVFRMLSPVMDSLGRVHEHGLVHRDISLSNLMLTKKGSVKLLDFGTARDSNAEDERSISLILTPGFAPEEQYRSRGIQGPWTDVYSLCASIYKMITGKTPETSMNRVFEETLQPPSALGAVITPAQEAVLLHGLGIRQADRIQSMEELKRGFEQAASAGGWVDEDGRPAYGPDAHSEEETVPLQADSPTQPAQPGKNGASDAHAAQPGQPGGQSAQPGLQAAQGRPSDAQPAQPGGQNAQPAHADGDLQKTEPIDDVTVPGSAGMPVPDPAAKIHVPDEPRRPAAADADGERTVRSDGEQTVPSYGDQAIPEYEVPPAGGPAGIGDQDGADDAKARGRKGRSPQKKGVPDAPGKKKSKKLPLIIACAAAALLLVIVIGFAGGQKYDETSVFFHDQTITEDDISAVKKADQVDSVDFTECRLSDETIAQLGEIDHVKDVNFTECSGFTTLDPLTGLTHLYYASKVPADLSAIMPKKMDALTNLIIHSAVPDPGFLERYPALETLDMSKCVFAESADSFPQLPNLISLTLSEADLSGMDLSNVGSCPQLRTFCGALCGLKDLDFLKGAAALQYLDVRGNAITSVEPLSGSTELLQVELSQNQISDLSPLAGCAKLTKLTADKNKLEKFPQMACGETLANLDLDTNAISDLTPLQSMTALTKLDLSRNGISDISALRACTKMKELALNHNEVKDLSPCAEMIDLTSLEAVHNQITSTKGMENMTQLSYVYLSNNEIGDVSVLAKSQGLLKQVLLDHNKISDISALQDNPELTIVLLDENQLTDLGGLSGCPAIEYLSAYGNRISDISALSECTSLWYLDLGENEISSIEPLRSAYSGNTNNTEHLLLQNNKITDLSALNPEQMFTLLSVYGNEITDLSLFAGDTNIGAYYLSWYEGFDAEAASNSNLMANLVDVPMDQRAGIKKLYGIIEPHFISKEEADAQIAKVRSEQRTKAGVDLENQEEKLEP